MRLLDDARKIIRGSVRFNEKSLSNRMGRAAALATETGKI
jgi:hypothetical protein